MQEGDTIPQDSPEGDHLPSRELPEGAAYLNARVLKGMNTTVGNPQRDKQKIVNVSEDDETITTPEKITKENKSGYAQHARAQTPSFFWRGCVRILKSCRVKIGIGLWAIGDFAGFVAS
jgi:hypothetical protein